MALLQERWREIVERVGQLAPLAKGYLIDAKPIEVTALRVTLGFDPEFASNIQKFEMGRNVQALQKALEEKLGRQVTAAFRVLGGAATGTLPDDRKPEAPPAPGAAPAAPAAGRGRKAWVDDAAVKRTLETFHGDILDIRE